ncbi:hypothetical protein HDU67_010439 [Dinochytrium kinnereticum]|nr:hypothetical protein HDU67_010439 [Dinochytrium kinnereticum]
MQPRLGFAGADVCTVWLASSAEGSSENEVTSSISSFHSQKNLRPHRPFKFFEKVNEKTSDSSEEEEEQPTQVMTNTHANINSISSPVVHVFNEDLTPFTQMSTQSFCELQPFHVITTFPTHPSSATESSPLNLIGQLKALEAQNVVLRKELEESRAALNAERERLEESEKRRGEVLQEQDDLFSLFLVDVEMVDGVDVEMGEIVVGHD